jgi:hypothetical protein
VLTMEEELNRELLSWALDDDWMASYDDLWKKMDCTSVVSRRWCEKIMGISARSGAWDRVRGELLGGGGTVCTFSIRRYSFSALGARVRSAS